MTDQKQLFEELRHIECATDNLLDRIIDVLEHHNPTGEYQIIAKEDDDFIHDNVRVYNAYSESGEAASIGIVVQEGLDHYVARVIDAYELQ